MKNRIHYLKLSQLLIIIAVLPSCTKDGYLPNPNNCLKKIRSDGYVVEQISYNQNNLVSEVNSTMFYRKFHYDNNYRLIKEEVAISPNSFSSTILPGTTHEFVDPDKTGIWMYHFYKYQDNGNLVRKLNFVPEDGQLVFRSMTTYEYNDNNMISIAFLHDSDSAVTQFWTYRYDTNRNVIEENYYTYLFILSGTGPKHLNRTNYEYDSYFNPFTIFKHTGRPGIYTNTNNIIKTKTFNYEPTPGIDDYSEYETSYEYNYESGYPLRVKGGEEYIYE